MFYKYIKILILNNLIILFITHFLPSLNYTILHIKIVQNNLLKGIGGSDIFFFTKNNI